MNHLGSQIFGPGSGHHMNCPLCGYSGNSYYHVACPGGHCYLCNKTGSRNICFQCNRVVCDEHLVYEVPLQAKLCLECSAKYRGEKFTPPKKLKLDPNCQCYNCQWEKQFKGIRRATKKETEEVIGVVLPGTNLKMPPKSVNRKR